MSKKILVSSCLIGKKCSYDGQARTSERVKELCSRYSCIDVCPEIEAGLGCPRESHEIKDGTGEDVLEGRSRVKSVSEKDHTEDFLKGARRALQIALKNEIPVAIMKARSPSCGVHRIYSGKFNGTLKSGSGVTSAILKRNGVKVFNEDETQQAGDALKGDTLQA
jgi:uncharacterized protein YbbK (DUF523 family)